uniref:Uncharacterized protein n=1 Tax=Acrobeloides nanus TaxID=290746 RepID=A0A914DXZ3_9BILA
MCPSSNQAFDLGFSGVLFTHSSCNRVYYLPTTIANGVKDAMNATMEETDSVDPRHKPASSLTEDDLSRPFFTFIRCYF